MDVQTKTLLCVITAILVDVSGHTMIPVPRRGKNKLIFWWVIMRNWIPISSRYWLRKSTLDSISGFRVLTGLSRSILVFFKLKWHHFSKKTKVNRLQLGFWPDLAGSTEFFFLYFFFNPPRFQPRVGRVPDQPAGPSQTEF